MDRNEAHIKLMEVEAELGRLEPLLAEQTKRLVTLRLAADALRALMDATATEPQSDEPQGEQRDGQHRAEKRPGTTAAITSVLRDARRPMAPREILEELERRGHVPNAKRPSHYVGGYVMKMAKRPRSPVRRVGTGLYAYVNGSAPTSAVDDAVADLLRHGLGDREEVRL